MRFPLTTRLALVLGAGLLGGGSAHAQALADTLFTWQGYGRTGRCHVLVFASPAEDRRPYTVILQEVAGNDGPSTAADVRYLAELVGRTYGIEPSGASWVLHWGAFSFEGAAPDRDRQIFLRATFRRTGSGMLGSPSWRLLTREEVERLTDRQFR